MKVKNLEEGKIIPLSYDLMFKKVFGDPQDTRPLKYLLKVILGIDAKEITILNNEILGENINSKSTTVDLIAQLEDGTKIGIEMNRTVSQEIIERNLVFMFRIMGSNLRHGESYRLLDKHIQINFNLMGHRQAPIESYKLINTQNVKDVLSEKLEIVCVDIGYFWKRCYTKEEEALKEEDKVIGVMGIEDIKEAHRVISGDEIMEEIMKKVEGFSREDALLVSYDRDFHVKECARIEARQEVEKEMEELRKQSIEEGINQGITQGINQGINQGITQGINQGINQGIKQGIEQGSKEEKINIAKKMLENDCDVELISKVTGLSIKEIHKLK